MRLVIQRAQKGWVSVEGDMVAQVNHGLVILVGVGHADSEEEANWLAEKCVHLRIFEDLTGKTNLSISDVGGSALVISQFTLYADTKKGRRPSFVKAASPEVAKPLVTAFARALEGHGIPTSMGIFGAHMVVGIENDGPVTIVMERESGAN